MWGVGLSSTLAWVHDSGRFAVAHGFAKRLPAFSTWTYGGEEGPNGTSWRR